MCFFVEMIQELLLANRGTGQWSVVLATCVIMPHAGAQMKGRLSGLLEGGDEAGG